LAFAVAGLVMAIICEWIATLFLGATDVAGHIDKVVHVLRSYPRSAWIQANACAGLANLAFNDDERSEETMRSGGLGAVLEAMRNHSKQTELQAYGCAVVANLAHGSARRSLAIADAGGVERVVEVLQRHRHSAMAVRNACTALEQMALQLPERRNEVPLADGVSTVIDVLGLHLSAGDTWVVRTACAALEALTIGGRGESANALVVVRSGGIRHIIDAIRGDTRDLLLQGHCASALANVIVAGAAPDECIEEVAGAGGVDALISALHRFPDDSWAQGHTMRALAESTAPTAAGRRIDAGDVALAAEGPAATAALLALGIHAADAWVRGHACRLLENIASFGGEVSRGVIQERMSGQGVAGACDPPSAA